jgi:hypothetical protein
MLELHALAQRGVLPPLQLQGCTGRGGQRRRGSMSGQGKGSASSATSGLSR